MRSYFFPVVFIVAAICACSTPETVKKANNNNLAVIAYYTGNATGIDSFDVKKLTHIIFSFCHLKKNRLAIDDRNDSLAIRKLVSLKQKQPQLKIMLSLGGWGGCEFCSQVFSTDSGRKEFAASVKELCDTFQTDGIDLDWEYPVIEGYPGHQYKEEDRANFTALVKELRQQLGNDRIVSFAAGGFTSFLQRSIAWDTVMPLLDFVNIMSYDLVGGYATVTGHHTALYSSSLQYESADRAVRYLDSIGVPKNKIVIGAAFYARTWENVDSSQNGIFQKGRFRSFIPFREFDKIIKSPGYVFYYDSLSQATHAYSPSQRIFATFDDVRSVKAKTQYAIDKGLKGIMFWELSLDISSKGLLDGIYETKNKTSSN